MTTVLKQGCIVTLLTSYCGDDSGDCTSRHPCPDCVAMCNQFELADDVAAKFLHEVGKKLEAK